MKGDLHEMGKNLVCMMLECAGFRVMDLGMDVAPETFVAGREGQSAGYCCDVCPADNDHAPNESNDRRAARGRLCEWQVRIIVGGAPVTEAYAEEIGADGYAKDASQAVSSREKPARPSRESEGRAVTSGGANASASQTR